jgi:hypothetical protein
VHDAGESHQLGDYFVQIEDDVLFIRALGAVTEEIARGVVLLLGRVIERHGRVFIIGDLKDAGTIPPSSRRIFIEFGAKNSAAAIAFYGVGFLVRGVNALLFGAVNLIGKQPQNLRQFSTEQEARSWIAVERRRLLS